MKEPKFTKGPWRVLWPVPSSGLCRKILAADNTAIMGDEQYYPWTPKSGDDWMLIAAAPEMYDLLASIENDGNQVPAWLWDKIQNTLAKARGES